MREACPWMPSGWPAGRVRKPQVCSFAMGSITSYLGQQAELALKPWLPPESVCPALPPAQGPRGGADPRPKLHACPMLSSVSALRQPSSGLHHAASSAPAHLPAPLETCPFRFSILPLLLFIVLVSGPGRQRGSQGPAWTPRSQCLRSSEPLAASLPAPHGLSLPDGRFRGEDFCLFVSLQREKKKSIQLCRGVALFWGFVIFLVWFGFHFSRRLVAVPRHLTSLFPALSSSTDATRWQF